MLFDILVFGVIILCLNKLVGKRIEKWNENQRYLEEIDDFRGWESDEAAYRIAGNLRRLMRNGYKGRIDLEGCYLSSINLSNDKLLKYISKHLSGVNFAGASFLHTDLRGFDLEGANLKGADLRGVKNLTLNQLSQVKSLYNAKLDPKLMEQVKEKYPHLLEKPVE